MSSFPYAICSQRLRRAEGLSEGQPLQRPIPGGPTRMDDASRQGVSSAPHACCQTGFGSGSVSASGRVQTGSMADIENPVSRASILPPSPPFATSVDPQRRSELIERVGPPRAAGTPRKELSEKDFRTIAEMKAEGFSASQVARELGISKSTLVRRLRERDRERRQPKWLNDGSEHPRQV